jgi:hypothetical protein
LKTIERLKAEIVAAEGQIASLDGKLSDKVKIAEAEYEAAKATLDSNLGVAGQYADKTPVDTASLLAEINNAEAMKKHLNEYARMKRMQLEVDDLQEKSDMLTEKIELARKLPGMILKEAKIPVRVFRSRTAFRWSTACH